LIMKLPNAHSRVAKSLIKQNCFKMHHLTNKSIATPHTLLASQPLRNEVSIAVRPEWLVDPSWPLHFNKAFGTSEQQYSHGWLQITNCLSKKPASMAQCSHKECLHHYHKEIHSSSLPSSTDHPAEKKLTWTKHELQLAKKLLAQTTARPVG
jgi:hypothetical protein